MESPLFYQVTKKRGYQLPPVVQINSTICLAGTDGADSESGTYNASLAPAVHPTTVDGFCCGVCAACVQVPESQSEDIQSRNLVIGISYPRLFLSCGGVAIL